MNGIRKMVTRENEALVNLLLESIERRVECEDMVISLQAALNARDGYIKDLETKLNELEGKK
jgi:hypothetical protein